MNLIGYFFDWWYGKVSYIKKFAITLLGFAVAIALDPSNGVVGIVWSFTHIHPYFYSIVLIFVSLYLLFFYRRYYIPFLIFLPLTLYTVFSVVSISLGFSEYFNIQLNVTRAIPFVPVVLYSSLSDLWLSVAYRENNRTAAKG